MPHFWNSMLSKQNRISITRHSTNVFRIFLNISRLLITRDNWAHNVMIFHIDLYEIVFNLVTKHLVPVRWWMFGYDAKRLTLEWCHFIACMYSSVFKFIYTHAKLCEAIALVNSTCLLSLLTTKCCWNCDFYFHFVWICICFYTLGMLIYIIDF